MDLDNFEFDDIVLKDAVVINTLVTYFNDDIFGRPNLIRNIFNHFGNDAERYSQRNS